MLESISNSILKTWRDNFTNPKNKHLETITESSVISLNLLQQFIDKAKAISPDVNGARIYFIRYTNADYDWNTNPDPKIIAVPNSNFSQVSLAFVPVEKFQPVTLKGKDCVVKNQILTLTFCYDDDTNETGHCPPKCGNGT